MLDDNNVIGHRDASGALGVAAEQYAQAKFAVSVTHGENDGRHINRIVVAGMGGSALAALLVKSWMAHEIDVPIDVVRTYDLPAYVDANTLVIASSYSGNTEETISCLLQARERNAQIGIIASGGALEEAANQHEIAFVQLPMGLQPRMAVIYNLRALTALLAHFGVTNFEYFAEIAETADWLHEQSSAWTSDITTDKNYAKQLALQLVGKTPVFYAGPIMAPVAYKWKISLNETSKNLAFWNEYPEFNHNEFMGWTSHPIEKPFVIIDLISQFEHPQVLKRFEISDRLLSGRRPKANVINLQGRTVIEQMLWGSVLADFVSMYVAILNGVDPTPVDLIEKLKVELVK